MLSPATSRVAGPSMSRQRSVPESARNQRHGVEAGVGAASASASEMYRNVFTGASAKRADYLLGSYRNTTAPEPNSSRSTSSRSRGFDSPANRVGP